MDKSDSLRVSVKTMFWPKIIHISINLYLKGYTG